MVVTVAPGSNKLRGTKKLRAFIRQTTDNPLDTGLSGCSEITVGVASDG